MTELTVHYWNFGVDMSPQDIVDLIIAAKKVIADAIMQKEAG